MAAYQSFEQYYSALERHGFAVLGEGCYGRVYGREGSPWVLKLGCDPTDGWPCYAAMVLERHASNPYAPRIKSLRWHTLPGNRRFYVAVMERLGRTAEWFRRGDCRGLAYKAAYYGVIGSDGREEREYLRGHPDLAALVADIRTHLLPLGHADLHRGNAMTRPGDPEHIVITDPLGSSSKPPPPVRMSPGQLRLPF